MLVLLLEKHFDALPDESGRGLVFRVWDRPPHPISRRLVQTERDDDWLVNHVSSFWP
jgi:hypothetical protein